jgi:hypothetical protein
MIAQISETQTPTQREAQRRIPPYIYPDVNDRERIIKFTITGYTQRQIHKIDLSIQVRHGGRWFLGVIELANDGWYVANVDRQPIDQSQSYETPEAAAIAAHILYLDAKRAARVQELR